MHPDRIIFHHVGVTYIQLILQTALLFTEMSDHLLVIPIRRRCLFRKMFHQFRRQLCDPVQFPMFLIRTVITTHQNSRAKYRTDQSRIYNRACRQIIQKKNTKKNGTKQEKDPDTFPALPQINLKKLLSTQPNTPCRISSR